jgi:hypothetical protein
MTKRRRYLIVALVILVGLAVFGSQKGNRVAGTVGGRAVVGLSKNVLAEARFSGRESDATFSLGARTATVTGEAVTFDGQSIPIPAACKRVEIQETGQGLRVSFDGVAVP